MTAAYSFLLSAATGLAVGFGLDAPRFGVLAAGALLLVSGDLLLLLFELPPGLSPLPMFRPSEQRSHQRFPSAINSAAQLLRAPGQVLIVVSIWSALQDPISLHFPLIV